METYVIAALTTAIGVIVSLAFFLITYRQTFGAYQERLKTANLDVERILVRRIVTDNYAPTAEEVQTIQGSKSREHRVKMASMLSIEQVEGDLFTRLIENDFVATSQRTELLKSLKSLSDRTPQMESLPELPGVQQEDQHSRIDVTQRLLTALAASVVGTSAAAIGFYLSDSDAFALLLPIFGLSIGFVGILAAYLRSREPEGTPDATASQSISSGTSFRRQVREFLREKVPSMRLAPGSSAGFDYEIKVGPKRLLLEVRPWDRQSSFGIKRAISKLGEALSGSDASEGIIVVSDTFTPPDDIQMDGKIKIMKLPELAAYIASDTAP